jgi:hypothetical protein
VGGRYALWLLALTSAVVAHFLEIHFGIAIAATRTYFWLFAAVMVAIGWRLSLEPAEAKPVPTEAVVPAQNQASDPRVTATQTSSPHPQPQQPAPGRGSHTSDWLREICCFRYDADPWHDDV